MGKRAYKDPTRPTPVSTNPSEEIACGRSALFPRYRVSSQRKNTDTVVSCLLSLRTGHHLRRRGPGIQIHTAAYGHVSVSSGYELLRAGSLLSLICSADHQKPHGRENLGLQEMPEQAHKRAAYGLNKKAEGKVATHQTPRSTLKSEPAVAAVVPRPEEEKSARRKKTVPLDPKSVARRRRQLCR